MRLLVGWPAEAWPRSGARQPERGDATGGEATGGGGEATGAGSVAFGLRDSTFVFSRFTSSIRSFRPALSSMDCTGC